MCRSFGITTLCAMMIQPLARVWLAVGLVVSTPLYALGTPAGTLINNIAQASYLDGGITPVTIQSNMTQLRIDEVIDLNLSVVGAQPAPVAIDGQPRVMTFRLVNSGNGPEQFVLSADDAIGGNMFTPGISFIALDRDANDRFDALIDTPYRPGVDDPLLAADQGLTLFVVSPLNGTPTEGARAAIELTARAQSGSGTTGQHLAGKGAAGGDAILGLSGGMARARGSFLVSSSLPKLEKSVSVQNSSGQNQPVPGAILTYQITADLRAAAVATPIVEDAIPAGTIYENGSMTLNGQPLTDADDSDAGHFTGTAIEVALDPAAPDPSTISFRVRIL